MTPRESSKRLGRILSIDPRSRRTAWSYFREGELRDCRIRTFRTPGKTSRVGQEIVPYIGDLLDHYSPHALLVPRIRGAGTRPRSPEVEKIVRAAVKEALRRGLAVHVLSTDTVKRTFKRPDGTPAQNQRDIHDAILEQFPELTMMVPKPRTKVYEPEEYFTPLFNTIAMYLAFEAQPSPMDQRH